MALNRNDKTDVICKGALTGLMYSAGAVGFISIFVMLPASFIVPRLERYFDPYGNGQVNENVGIGLLITQLLTLPAGLAYGIFSGLKAAFAEPVLHQPVVAHLPEQPAENLPIDEEEEELPLKIIYKLSQNTPPDQETKNESKEEVGRAEKQFQAFNPSCFFNSQRRFENCRHSDESIVDGIHCPISKEIMDDPVYIEGHKKHKYDRKSLEKWFITEEKRTIPHSNVRLSGDSVVLVSDVVLKAKIQAYLEDLEIIAEKHRKLSNVTHGHKRALSQ